MVGELKYDEDDIKAKAESCASDHAAGIVASAAKNGIDDPEELARGAIIV